CDEQDCGLNMGQLWMQISWESGSVFNANQHTPPSVAQQAPISMISISSGVMLPSSEQVASRSTTKNRFFIFCHMTFSDYRKHTRCNFSKRNLPGWSLAPPKNIGWLQIDILPGTD
ncbi:hypothetical protein, partial [Herbaspirillum sp. NPDC087042]|uniref:hypothetical protein n=1 Tax=Herbaspirillum sp. NPDC087042 TaxID=3364004 RepID=UPI0037FD5102